MFEVCPRCFLHSNLSPLAPSTQHITSQFQIMTGWDYAMDYSKCTVAEVQGFVRSRTSNQRYRKLRSDSTNTLPLLDNNATFRFFDLAPELRNMIYRELLVVSTENS